MEVQETSGRIEARACVEDVVRFVLDESAQARAVNVHCVQIRSESTPCSRRRRERENNDPAIRTQSRRRRDTLWRKINEPPKDPAGLIHRAKSRGAREDVRGREACRRTQGRRALTKTSHSLANAHTDDDRESHEHGRGDEGEPRASQIS